MFNVSQTVNTWHMPFCLKTGYNTGMKNSFASYRFISLSSYRRVIVISDIHGDPEGYRLVKEACGFSHEDALIIVGDLLEKGADSLTLVRDVMRDVQKGNVFVTAGNNDRIFTMWQNRVFKEEEILLYLTSLDMKNSILANMAEENGFVPDMLEKLEQLHVLAQEKYAEEAAFLRDLPVILESEDYIFVHAGIHPGSLHEQDEWECLTMPEFALQPGTFDKPVIAGHWPSANYSGNRIVNRVFYEPSHPSFSIDGANSMKTWGQISYLILYPGTQSWESGYCDALPLIQVQEDQDETREPVSLLFPHTRITVIHEQDGVCTCRLEENGHLITVKKERMYRYKEQMYCYDYTDYHLPLQKGDIVSYIEPYDDEILIKKDGIIGLYKGSYTFL